MGCGASDTKLEFDIILLNLIQHETNQGLSTFKFIYKERHVMYEKHTVIQYMVYSENEEIKKLFKNTKLLKNCIYNLVFDNGKTVSVEYVDVYAFIPKDEHSFYRRGNSPIMLTKVYIIPPFNLKLLKQTIKNVIKQIEGVKTLEEFNIKNVDFKDEIVPDVEVKKDEEKKEEEKVEEKIEEKIEEKKEEIPEPYVSSSSDSDNTIECSDDDLDESENKIEIKNELIKKSIEDLQSKLKNEKDKNKKLKAVSLSFLKKIESDEGYNNLKEFFRLLEPDNYKSYLPNKSKLFKKQEVNKEYYPHYLHNLQFSDNYIKKDNFDNGWQVISDFLIKKQTPRAIHLDENDKKNRKYHVLRNLDLSMNFITDNTCEIIFKSLRKVRLHSLNLGSNLISSEGTQFLSRWLKKNKSIKELFLQQNSKNEFSKLGLSKILDSIICHRKLQSLNLSNMNIKNSGEEIGKIISDSKVINLRLRDCGFILNDIIQIYNGLNLLSEKNTANKSKSKIIKMLDLSENNIENDEGEIFTDIFAFDCIESIHLEKNKLNQVKTQQKISKLLKINPSLEIDINKNINKSKSNESESNTEFKYINLSENNFDYESFINYFYDEFKKEISMLYSELEISIADRKKPTKADEDNLKRFNGIHTPLTISIS